MHYMQQRKKDKIQAKLIQYNTYRLKNVMSKESCKTKGESQQNGITTLKLDYACMSNCIFLIKTITNG